jgi:hypothetical protein
MSSGPGAFTWIKVNANVSDLYLHHFCEADAGCSIYTNIQISDVDHHHRWID